MHERFAIAGGAVLAGLAVALGAWGAHGLEEHLAQGTLASAASDDGANDLAQRLGWWDTAVRYHLAHSIALIIVGMLKQRRSRTAWGTAGWLLVGGVALFAGSLYSMTLLGDDWKWLGAVVPIGGLLLILGWAAIAWGAWREE